MEANIDITLNSLDYDILEVFYTSESGAVVSERFLKGYDIELNESRNGAFTGALQNEIANLTRHFTHISDNNYKSGNCIRQYTGPSYSGSNTRNQNLVPIKIYGIKI